MLRLVLLVTSLQVEERRRRRRRLILISLGALTMTALCIVLITLVGAPATEKSDKPNPEQAAQLSQEGWNLWQKQEFAAAVPKFEAAVKLDRKNTGAWNGLGWSRFNSGDTEGAEVAFQNVIELEPNHPAALNGLGQLALAQRKYDLAEKYLLKAARKEATAAWYGLAKLYLIKGNYNESAKWALKVIKSGEGDGEIAEILQAAKAKKVPDALRRSLDPQSGSANAAPNKDVARAWQLCNQGRRAEGKALFLEVLSKSPQDAAALNGMGWCLLGGGDIDEAKPYFEKCLAIDPKAGGAMNGLARVLKAQDDLDGAIKIWQQMVDDIPGPHAGTYGLADAYLEKGELKKALPLLEELAKSKPDDRQLQAKLAKAKADSAE
jgi:Flp pilus assembly protein TadD